MKTHTRIVLAGSLLFPVALVALQACGSTVEGGGSGGSASATTGDVTSTSSAGGASSTSTASAGGAQSTGVGTSTSVGTGSSGGCSGPSMGLGNYPCTPKDPTCGAQTSVCLALNDNKGLGQFGMRIADLQFFKPVALTKGLVNGVINNGAVMNLAKCNLNGGGTFSWLLYFDTAAGTIKTGGAKPVVDPTQGYSFVDEMVSFPGLNLHVAPVTLTAPLGPSCSATSSVAAGDLVLPVYLDAQATSAVYLPLKQTKLSSVQVSGDHNCVGIYNAKGLNPASGCVSDNVNPAFMKGGQVDGIIDLETADAIPIKQIGQTLCVVLSGDAATYGDGGSPLSKCKRQNGKIVFPGDWCEATNQPGSAQCHDAVQMQATFAASGVKIN